MTILSSALLRPLRSQLTDYSVTGRKTLLPDNITADGMTAINVQPTQNAVMRHQIACRPLSEHLWAHATKGQRRDERFRITLRNLQ